MTRPSGLFVWVLPLLLALTLVPPIARAAAGADLAIYEEALASDWDNWSWSTTTSFAATSPVQGGVKSIAVTYTAAWAGLYLHAAPAVDLTAYESLRFWIHGGSAGGQQLRVVANTDSVSVAVTAQANTWTQVTVPFSALGGPASLSDLWWQDSTGGAQPTFYLDDIVLVAASGPPPLPPPPGTGPPLNVDVQSARHAISEDIYGMNFADEQMAAALRLPVRRWGGNSTSRYNWQNDTHNTGSDWYFENIPEDNPNPAALPDGSAADRFVEQDRRTGTKTLLTAPLLGWVPKRRLASHPYDCGFKVSKYGAQQSVDPWDTDCGNGVGTTGSDITGNDPTDTSVQVGPSFVGDWLGHLTGKYGTASQGGVAYYNLDNEPMLWNSTHRDVHPQGASYDEIRDLTYAYAAAIKAADGSAKTLGPVLWGWCAYFYSARDGCSIGTDYQTHGNTPFVPWYLQQMGAYQGQHGVRLLDYLDLHYYPQAGGVALSPGGNATTQALRLRSTRSLWDPSYIDESWISDMEPGGVAVRLIPRMKEWVTANYPGTKLAITEYNWGALDHINGALAQADVLGIFGRDGLDLATLWGPPTLDQPGAFAFRIYRNYDGAGSGFGSTSVQATSGDQGSLAVYAAQRSTDNALTVVVINKTANSLTSDVGLAGFTPDPAAAVYRYSTASPTAIVQVADQPVTATGFSATFPANSITLFVLLPQTVVTVSLTVGKSGTGAGTVTSSPAGIDCGNTCSGEFESGASVTLTATPAIGSTFAGWSVDGDACPVLSNGGLSCAVTMTQARNVTATFASVAAVECTVTTAPAGRQITVDGRSYTAAQTFAWTPGSQHDLGVPSPQGGGAGTRYLFSAWSDGGAQSHSISVPSSPATYTAAFATQHLLTIVITGTGTVTVTPPGEPGSVACITLLGVSCFGSWHPTGTSVTLTPVSAPGWAFAGWGGGVCTGVSPTCTLSMTAPRTVTATFSRIFTDDPLVPRVTTVKAVHITELREAVDTLRARWGLGAFTWTDPSLAIGSTPVKAQHVTDLRTALSGAYTSAGRTPPSYTDPTLTPRVTLIKAVHVTELRTAVRGLE